MKYLFGVLFLFVSGIVYPATVVNYDDGSTYTLSENQEIYISTPKSALFKRQLMNNKDTFFRVQKPWTKRDYVPVTSDNYTVGSHEWCKTYVPWSEGLSFDMITWQQSCDTDNDSKYGCGDSQFDNSEDGGVCN